MDRISSGPDRTNKSWNLEKLTVKIPKHETKMMNQGADRTRRQAGGRLEGWWRGAPLSCGSANDAMVACLRKRGRAGKEQSLLMGAAQACIDVVVYP